MGEFRPALNSARSCVALFQVGPPEMHEIHQRLIEMSQKTQDLDKRLETMRRDLDTEVQKNARLEPDVNNFREREKFLEKVNLLKMKRPWLVYRLSLHIYIFVRIYVSVPAAHVRELSLLYAFPELHSSPVDHSTVSHRIRH